MFYVAGDDVLEVRDGESLIDIIDGICALNRGPTHECGNGAKDRVVVGFRSAAGKDNFLRTRADQLRDLLARCFHRGTRSLAEGVNRSSVSKFSGEVREHGIEDTRLDGGGGIMIQIDASHSHAIRIDPALTDSKRSAARRRNDHQEDRMMPRAIKARANGLIDGGSPKVIWPVARAGRLHRAKGAAMDTKVIPAIRVI